MLKYILKLPQTTVFVSEKINVVRKKSVNVEGEEIVESKKLLNFILAFSVVTIGTNWNSVCSIKSKIEFMTQGRSCVRIASVGQYLKYSLERWENRKFKHLIRNPNAIIPLLFGMLKSDIKVSIIQLRSWKTRRKWHRMLLMLSHVLLYGFLRSSIYSGCQSAQQYTLPHLNDQVGKNTNFDDSLSLHHQNK